MKNAFSTQIYSGTDKELGGGRLLAETIFIPPLFASVCVTFFSPILLHRHFELTHGQTNILANSHTQIQMHLELTGKNNCKIFRILYGRRRKAGGFQEFGQQGCGTHQTHLMKTA